MTLFQTAITIIGSVLASSGFWAFMQRKADKKDLRTQMLIGLGHDRIISLGMSYIERGYITQDEFENLYDYLYKPYEAMGGKLEMDSAVSAAGFGYAVFYRFGDMGTALR